MDHTDISLIRPVQPLKETSEPRETERRDQRRRRPPRPKAKVNPSVDEAIAEVESTEKSSTSEDPRAIDYRA